MDGCEIHKPHLLETMVETISFVGIYVGESSDSRASEVVRNGLRSSTVGPPVERLA